MRRARRNFTPEQKTAILRKQNILTMPSPGFSVFAIIRFPLLSPLSFALSPERRAQPDATGRIAS